MIYKLVHQISLCNPYRRKHLNMIRRRENTSAPLTCRPWGRWTSDWSLICVNGSKATAVWAEGSLSITVHLLPIKPQEEHSAQVFLTCLIITALLIHVRTKRVCGSSYLWEYVVSYQTKRTIAHTLLSWEVSYHGVAHDEDGQVGVTWPHQINVLQSISDVKLEIFDVHPVAFTLTMTHWGGNKRKTTKQ